MIKRSSFGRHLLLASAVIVTLISPGAHGASSTGSAQTANHVLSLSVAGTEVIVGADAAEATKGSAPEARAAFTAGRSAGQTAGSLERTGTGSADNGSDEVGEGQLSLEGLLSLNLIEASASIDLSDERVASQTDATLASIQLLDGLVTLEGVVSSAAASVDESSSEAMRTITLDGLQIFDVAGLLDALGIDALELSCEGYEGTGTALGVVGADQTCEQLAAATSALAQARADLDALAAGIDGVTAGHDDAQVEADRAAAAAISCAPLDLLCIASALVILTDLATTYDIDLSDPTDLTTTRDEVVAALDALLILFDDRSVLGEAIDQAATGTCDATIDALAAAESDLVDDAAAAVLEAARIAVDGACAVVRATTDEVLAAPVVTMDDVSITLGARAAEDDTDAGVTVSIGVVRIGLNEPVAIADLDAGLSAVATIADAIEAIIEGLMIDAPTPEIELFAVETSEGQAGDGSWHAAASLAILQITQPSGPLTIPDEAPFAILGGASAHGAGAGGGFGLGASPRALLAGIVDGPEIVARAIVFDAASMFAPASGDGGGGDSGSPGDDDPGSPGNDGDGGDGDGGDGAVTDQGDALPITGLADRLLSLVASLALLAALGVRRWMRAAA